MRRVHPPRLRRGSTVAVVAPAGPVDPRLLAEGIAVLESWDLTVRVGDHVLGHHPKLPYLAGSDADRARDFQRAWCDPAVEAVICARGGYGGQRVLDLLDWSELAAAGPKVFVGSSDATCLHDAIGARLDLVTLFGPMIAGALFDVDAQRHLQDTLFYPESARRLIGPTTATAGHGVARGITVGGNLSLITAGLGAADYFPPPDGAILLLEDVNEAPYRIDRMLTQLLRAGWFTGVSGIALGSWAGCGQLEEVYTVTEDLLGGLGLPMVWELGFGHCPGQLTVPLGVEAVLDADDGTLTVDEAALA
ncbi:S66 peptidase family protein [Actinokineospora cianjurensis]|uniref:Muramoyltetrapeptide carboxypeptidase n=1 Tax=Actinokineospora cianjurensis TaxID=585224 RepID=A0A421B2Z4_9PSEU|nr:LD-carboxypeptidase [Actinokineospora cianjurensis]RLK58638.1 muramoyltetrapeptide carboxypeptidase [Actinokineospora cianjurensis]